MGSARGNEALGLAGRPGAVTFPESSRGSLTPAAGGMSCFPQGQHRIIHSVRPAPFSRHQQQLPGGQGKRGRKTHPSCVFIRRAIVDSHPTHWAAPTWGLKSGQSENRSRPLGAMFAVLSGRSGARQTCSG